MGKPKDDIITLSSSTFQFKICCHFIERVIYRFENIRKFLQVTVVNILEEIAQHVDHASLNICLGIDSAAVYP